MSSKFGRAAWALLSALLLPSSAAAGPRETLRTIAFHPSDPNTYAAVFNEAGGGLLITHDGGHSFQLSCMSYVMGEVTTDGLLPVVTYTADGHLVLATFYGLFRDDGHGCAFTRASELGDSYVVGLTVDPSQPNVLYALTSSYGQDNGIYRSLDQGATWSAMDALENAFFRRLDIVTMPDGHRRFYVSLARIQEQPYAIIAAVRVSDDEGTTFQEYAFPQDSDMTLAGVDTLNPERLYALAPAADASVTKVLLNDQGGKPEGWRELGSVKSAGNLEVLPEGGFFVVDLGARALFRLNETADGLVLVDEAEITCFEQSPLSGERFSCATWRMLGADASGAHTDRTIYDMNWLDAVVSCGAQGSDVIASCQPQFDYGWCGPTHFPDAPLCKELRGEEAGCGDGGTCADAGAPAPVAPKGKSGGCAVVAAPGRGRTGVVFPGMLIGLALALRTRGVSRSLRSSRRK